MKVAYVLNTPNAANYKVGEMILPQLESDSHGVDVVGIFFFDDRDLCRSIWINNLCSRFCK